MIGFFAHTLYVECYANNADARRCSYFELALPVGKYVSILLNTRGFSFQMDIKSTKLLTSSYTVIFKIFKY